MTAVKNICLTWIFFTYQKFSWKNFAACTSLLPLPKAAIGWCFFASWLKLKNAVQWKHKKRANHNDGSPLYFFGEYNIRPCTSEATLMVTTSTKKSSQARMAFFVHKNAERCGRYVAYTLMPKHQNQFARECQLAQQHHTCHHHKDDTRYKCANCFS